MDEKVCGLRLAVCGVQIECFTKSLRPLRNLFTRLTLSEVEGCG
jgi:hypothetical protein